MGSGLDGLLSSTSSLLRTTSTPVLFTGIIAFLISCFLSAYLLITLVAHYPRPETESERKYRTITATHNISHPRDLPETLSGGVEADYDADIEISVVVPAYNERERLPAMLAEAVSFLHSTYSAHASARQGANGGARAAKKGKGWEILIVDDGSMDGTAEVALKWAKEHMMSDKPEVESDQIRVCVLAKNRGKGGAVTHGMRHVRGRYAVFADADGASKFSDLAQLLEEVVKVERKGFGIAVGSRAHMVNTDAVVKRSFLRNALMYAFHTLLRTFGIRHIHDTQCGFKLFSLASIRAIFPYMHTEGWIFDIEILLLAWYKNIPVVEVPITWHEVEGTKMSLFRDSVAMAWDLLVVRAGYVLGVYQTGTGGPGVW